ncbi:unnamed protein product [Cyclocybe aegerita]|uniref:Cytochrome P450 n=1 Tax=Cyclocybe aegerita TaxID=1973307 RepID=A0A8S0W9D7_CYCAE|nr:unnamed protein product [Cyclocybe aegerita]
MINLDASDLFKVTLKVTLLLLAGRTTIPLLLRYFRSTLCHDVPTVGSSNALLSFLGVFRFWHDAVGMIQDGNAKYPGRAFQLPHPDRWIVYVTDPELIREISSMSTSFVSLMGASDYLFQVQYTGLYQDQQVVNLIRTRITRTLPTLVPKMCETAAEFLRETIPDTGNGWATLPALDVMSECASRITARMFVGSTPAHDKEYTRLCIQWVLGIVKTSILLNSAPNFTRRTLNWLFNPLPRILDQATKNLTSFINQRVSSLHEKSEEEESNETLLDGLLRLNNDRPLDTSLITKKLLSGSFAAIHTTSNILTFAILYLASRPEYIPWLREEVSTCVRNGQWTKSSIESMVRLESFLQESMRLSSVSAVSVLRRTVQPLTLSDGSYIPEGTILLASSLPAHRDPSKYPNPDAFDGRRFHTEEDSLTSPSLAYFPFGFGPHTCPGRFIASSILKTVMAQIVLHYDVKLDRPARPADCWVGIMSFPDPSSKVLFRRIRDEHSDWL